MGLPWQIIHGDVRVVCKTLSEKSFDACLCDPPYGLSFMGRKWDYDVPSVNLWFEVLRVLKPGAHAMMFGGPRTFHRVACAIEDAGFEIRDLCLFLHAKGFPKSLNIGKAIDARAGAKRQVVGTRVLLDTKDGNLFTVAKGERPKKVVDITAPATDLAKQWDGYGTALKPAHEPIIVARRTPDGTVVGNAIEWGVGGIDIDGSRIGNEVMTKSQSTGEVIGRSRSMAAPLTKSEVVGYVEGRWPSNVMLDEEAAGILDNGNRGASRFFFTSKASTFERDAGVDDTRNTHTTVKPIDLIRYFAKMLLPPKGEKPRRILVPFSGSGSEMIGCLQAGWDEVVGIEREAEYVAIAKQRIGRGGVYSQLQDRYMRRATSQKPSRGKRTGPVGLR